MERVFVVRRADHFAGCWPQGFVPRQGAAGRALVRSLERGGFFADREQAERTPAWKQLIPYCLLARPGELFCVQRLRRQTEGRLHGLYSIGVGGHVNPEDAPRADPGGLVEAALRRELAEELRIPDLGRRAPRLLGLLNDDATEVGSVHLGLVYLLELPADTGVEIRESAKMRGGFRAIDRGHRAGAACRPAHPPAAASGPVVEPDPLWQDSRGFESWSAIMLAARPWSFPGVSEGSEHGTDSREESHDG